MESASLKLAQGFAKDAQKASKGGWFSKPDWAIAAQYLDKAATAYKSARHYDEAVNCYTQASEAYIQMNVIHLAASCMENAAKLSEAHLKDHAKAITNYMRASDLYRSYGSAADKAAVMMEKAAKVCEDIDTDRAIQLYDNALSIYENEDRGRFGVETFKRTIQYMLDKGRVLEAVSMQLRLAAVCEQVNNRLELNRSYLSVIAMLLAFGDSVEAGKRLDEFGQDVAFIRTKEAEAAERLVQAYNDGDQDEYASIAGSLPVTSLDAVISRLTAKTRIPGARRPEPKATNSSAMQTGLTSSEKQAAFGGEHSGGSDRAAAAAPPFDDGDDDDDLL
ncbi:hypothetical protein H4R26_002429 [Coemansia thaxteri]|uniref:Gamma-soluble NSF attachment protein n=1 Tax=Coemansia thaxteri TaxID=2663907 RepID=A0A9W8BL02_9FUNG|nr:hypothetical protein H4R26_002429 [Coemansia thaxteri]